MRRNLSIALSLTILALLGIFVAPVCAHADLLSANPEPNTSVDSPLAQIELFFSEPIESSFSTVVVVDASGNRVDNDDVRVDPTTGARMTVSVRSLSNGVYTVSWKTLSSVDSHVTGGISVCDGRGGRS